MRCANCKYWKEHSKSRIEGTCEVIDIIGCGSPINDAYISVTVSDDTNLRATLITGPEFGCTLSEVKPPAK